MQRRQDIQAQLDIAGITLTRSAASTSSLCLAGKARRVCTMQLAMAISHVVGPDVVLVIASYGEVRGGRRDAGCLGERVQGGF